MCKNNRKERKGALSIFVSLRRGSSRAVVVTVARTVLQHAVVESSGSGWTQGKSEIWVGWTVWAVVGVEVDQGIMAVGLGLYHRTLSSCATAESQEETGVTGGVRIVLVREPPDLLCSAASRLGGKMLCW